MKDLAIDESLSEEARDSARKALEVLISSQLLDIEQAAALKKLESEALAEAKKVEVAALARRKKTEAKKLLQAAQVFEQTAEGLSDDMMDWLGQHRLQQCAADLARIAGAYAQPLYRCSAIVLCFIGGALLAGRWSLATCST